MIVILFYCNQEILNMAEKKGKNISGLIRMILKTGIAAAVIRWLYCRYAGNLSAVFAGFDVKISTADADIVVGRNAVVCCADV